MEDKTKIRISWWFNRGIVSLITIPIAIFIIVGTICALVQGGIQTLTYFRVLKAVFGIIGIIIFLFVWPFSLLMPAGLWWAALKKIPEVIQTQAKSRFDACGYFVAGFTLLIGLAIGMQWIHAKAIGWIADRNPEAAYEAGVIGSKMPSDIKDEIER